MGIKITNIEYYLPEKIITNDDIKKEHTNWDVDKTSEKTGVFLRHISANEETAFDLAKTAVYNLLNNLNIAKSEIGGIIFCTQSPDYIMPSNSFLIHKEFNFASNVWCFDYNLACSGFVYGLALVRGMIDTGMAKHVILINADTYSKYINNNDRSTSLLFGDGAAATLISYSKNDSLIDIELSSEGSEYKSFYIPAGGIRNPINQNTSLEKKDILGNIKSMEDIHMDGRLVFDFISKIVPTQINYLLKKNNFTYDKLDLVIFHQASKITLDALIKALNFNNHKCYINIGKVGNTVSASIPIALKNAIDENKIKRGDILLISGFGVGLSWGSLLLKY